MGIALSEAYSSTGCDACRGIGYKGRTGIFELLPVSHALRTLITQQPQFTRIYAQARDEGIQSLLTDAVQKVIQGVISMQELVRVLL